MGEKLDLRSLGEAQVRKNNKYQLFFNCPYHEDTKYHLGVNTKKGIYHCFKCGASGRIQDIGTPLSDYQRKVEEFLMGPEGEKERIKVELPEEMESVKFSSGLPYRYLKGRQVTTKEIHRYKIGYCGEGRFQDRIIIPIYDKDKLVYFVGRSYTNRQPKYMNATVPKEGVIFKTFTGRAKRVIICEGIFDALRVGKVFPAISILGKEFSGGVQMAKIKECAREAYMFLDNDAAGPGVAGASILNMFLPTRVMFIKGYKDPGEMSVEAIRRILP